MLSILAMALYGSLVPATETEWKDAVVVAGKSLAVPAQVLVEETAKRTKVTWKIVSKLPKEGKAIVLEAEGKGLPQEGFRVRIEHRNEKLDVIHITGASKRGVLFGVGHFLRRMNWSSYSVKFPLEYDVKSSPAYPIRGHQLGYRHTANSYDAWDVAQYDQYIRELALFGCNSVESIPFQDESSPVMPVPREVMNIKMSEICAKYDMDYWIWAPAVFDLKDQALRTKELEIHEAFYKACPRLDAIFFPGGDPGDNPPRLVMPFLKDLAGLLVKHHPKGQMWISLQGFNAEMVEEFYRYMEENKPEWLTGVVAGPQSPSILETRRRLAPQYKLRHYPDITHTVLCQYPVIWWDPAFAFTLGREPVNPQPRYYAHIHNWFAPSTDGVITYSDGIHDDLNKIVWSRLSWDPSSSVLDIVRDYCRFFFGPGGIEHETADALLALETNWDGSLLLNGGVNATWQKWDEMSQRCPDLNKNWRWRMHLFRARYDYYTRFRLEYETELERKANAILADAAKGGADVAMDAAMRVLAKAKNEPLLPDMRRQLEEDAEFLFQTIGFQTSVEKYHARNFERGAVMDSVDRPLNNLWWLEDEFKRIQGFTTDEEKVARLMLIGTWETPGPGSFYDDVGNVANSPHVVRNQSWITDPNMEKTPNPDFGTWMDSGKSRWRLSWLSTMDWPEGMVYEGLDPHAEYVLRATGRGDAFPVVNGEPLKASVYSKTVGEFKEWPIPRNLTSKGRIEVTWTKPDEGEINWRQASVLAEVWLIKRKAE